MRFDVTLLSCVPDSLADRLRATGLTASDKLIVAVANPEKRRTIAQQSGIDEGILVRLARRAELTHVHGIGPFFVNLLQHVGVASLSELAACPPDVLYARFVETRDASIVWRLPSLQETKSWVAQARQMEELLVD